MLFITPDGFRYEKNCIEDSVNVPYSGVALGRRELKALGPNAHRALSDASRRGKAVVVASAEDETAQLVSY